MRRRPLRIAIQANRGQELPARGSLVAAAPTGAAVSLAPAILERALRLGHRVDAGAVQRRIRVQGGATYGAAGELPSTVPLSSPLRGRADAAGTYLVKSAADLGRRARGEAAPMLSPHRHLIGERHDQSRYETALADWGWGADKMAEGFQTSATVTDELSEENRRLSSVGLVSNPYYQTKHLENLHPFMLSGLAMVIAILKELENNALYAAQRAQSVALRVDVETSKREFKAAEVPQSNGRKNLKDQWDANVRPHLASYERACRARLLTARGGDNSPPNRLHDLATYMEPRWGRLPGNIRYLADKPYGLLDSWQETYTKLSTYRTNANDFRGHVETFATHLIALTKSEAAATPLGGNPDQAIDTGWQTATQDTDPQNILQGGSRIRELFMEHNINTNLTVPGLVQIGSEHVTNLTGRITDGKYHADYAAFVQDTLQ